MRNEVQVKCNKCLSCFDCVYYHAGFSDQMFFYCNSCGLTNILDVYSNEMRQFRSYERFDNSKEDPELTMMKIEREVAESLPSCSCGGKFSVDAIPRCLHCTQEIEWDDFIQQIDISRIDLPKFRDVLKNKWRDRIMFIFNGKFLSNFWNK